MHCRLLACTALMLTATLACSTEPGAALADGGAFDMPTTDATAGTATGDDAGRPEAGAGKSPNGALAIVSLTPTSPKMTGGKPLVSESNTVTFIAIVTDSAGLDAVAGGQLMDDSGATYAAFGAGANKGTYTATLDWATMSSIRAATFDSKGGARTFVAKFFDNQNNSAQAQVDIGLSCRAADFGSLISSCGGQCLDTTRDGANCGACGTVCARGQACASSTCGPPVLSPQPGDSSLSTECLPSYAFSPLTTCDDVCAGAAHPCSRIRTFSQSDVSCTLTATDEHGSCTTELRATKAFLRCRCP